MLAILFLVCCTQWTAKAQPKPILVTSSTSTRAVAIDAIGFTSEPFSATPLPFLYSSDNQTRITLFAMNLSLDSGEGASAVTADAEDATHRHYNLVVEYVGKVSGIDWLSQINLRLDKEMGDAGDVLIKITYHGVDSNRVRVGIGHVGGGLSDDTGATPTPAPISTLSGRTMLGTTPLSGVSVVLSGAQTQTVTTDNNGNYTFLITSPGDYTLTPNKRFFTFTPASTVFSNINGSQTADFSAARATSMITGVVKDDEGNGIDGLGVAIKSSDVNSPPTYVLTNGGGNFSFTGLPQGDSYTLTATNTNLFAFNSQTVDLQEQNINTTFNGTRRNYRISGVALDFSQLPNPGVNVNLSGYVNLSTVTDANGKYSFDNLPAGRTYQLVAAKIDHQIEPGLQTRYLVGDEEVNFKAIRLYRITGRLADSSGKGIFGALIKLSGPENLSMYTPVNGEYSFTVITPGDYVLTPTRWQDFYQFSPANRSFINLSDHQVTNFIGTLTVPSPTYVLEFDGTPMSVDYGVFWPHDTNVGNFFWEIWAMPANDNYARYMLSEGYGGTHTVLFGFNSGPRGYTLMGNIWDGSQTVYFNSDDGPAPGEWGHYAVGWDGKNIITYYNGVPVGKQPFLGPRVSTGFYNGSTLLMIGGSNHQNFIGRIAQVRGYEENNPRESSPESTFAPETVFSQEGQLMSRYFTPAERVADLSNGYNGTLHDGWPRGMLEFYFYYRCEGCPIPKFVIDPTAPDFSNSVDPGQIVVTIGNAPATPNGARVFDSFTRNNATYILNGKGGLGSTETGSAGVKSWQTNIDASQSQPFGVLSERAVLLANDKALAWVSTGAGSGNLDIRVNRTRGTFNSGFDTGLSFRVVDANNFLFAYTSQDDLNPSGPRRLTLGYFLGGLKTVLTSSIAMPSGNWLTLRVVTTPAGNIDIYGDNVLVYSTNSAINASATGAGLYNNGPNMGLTNRWDNFTVLNAP